jgi:hypothetical protein
MAFLSWRSCPFSSTERNRRLFETILGRRLGQGQIPQLIVPANVWLGARLVEGGDWALLGTTVSSAFEFEDFEFAERSQLIKKYPKFSSELWNLQNRPLISPVDYFLDIVGDVTYTARFIGIDIFNSSSDHYPFFNKHFAVIKIFKH